MVKGNQRQPVPVGLIEQQTFAVGLVVEQQLQVFLAEWNDGGIIINFQLVAYSGERERPFWLNVNTFFLNASPTEVCTPGVHVQSIS